MSTKYRTVKNQLEGAINNAQALRDNRDLSICIAEQELENAINEYQFNGYSTRIKLYKQASATLDDIREVTDVIYGFYGV